MSLYKWMRDQHAAAVSKALEDEERSMHRELCLKLLNDDHGITEAGYVQLLSLGIVPKDIQNVVEAVDGRFFLPENFSCDGLHQAEVTTYDDGTYLLLSYAGEVLAVSGNSDFDDIDKSPTEKGVIIQIIGDYLPSEGKDNE
jgi:hypothetical protein